MAKHKNLDKTVRASVSMNLGTKRVPLNDMGYFRNFTETFVSGGEQDSLYGIEIVLFNKRDASFMDEYLRVITDWVEKSISGYCHISDSRYSWTANIIRIRSYSRRTREKVRKSLVELAVLARLELD